jgi:hypothetical protein
MQKTSHAVLAVVTVALVTLPRMGRCCVDYLQSIRTPKPFGLARGDAMSSIPSKKRPHVFVGSSTEGLSVAHAIQQNLSRVCDIQVWDQDVFGLSDGTLSKLIHVATIVDFAILVLTADELVLSRGARKPAPKDNVLVEIGLFIGKLGIDRTIIACDETKAGIKIPSDLAGITLANYRTAHAGGLVSALGPCSNKISSVIETVGPLPRSHDSFASILDFSNKIHTALLDLYSSHLDFVHRKVYQVVTNGSGLQQEDILQCHNEWKNYVEAYERTPFFKQLEEHQKQVTEAFTLLQISTEGGQRLLVQKANGFFEAVKHELGLFKQSYEAAVSYAESSYLFDLPVTNQQARPDAFWPYIDSLSRRHKTLVTLGAALIANMVDLYLTRQVVPWAN